MKQQLRQEINPQLLTVARQTRRMTQAGLAERLGVAQGTVSKVEAGVLGVTAAELQGLSITLDYPQEFFRLERRIEGPSSAELYHNRKRQKASVGLLQAIYATAAVREIHLEALLRSWPASDEDFPSFPIDEFNYTPPKIARTVRAIWRLPSGPVSNVTEAVESAGAIVLVCDFGTRLIDGFSRYRKNLPPFIFTNESLQPDRWRWTLAHELGHIVMHTAADPYPEMEADANAFASEFLTPAQEIKPQLANISFDKLSGLKRHWKVSMQALLMRAHELELISSRQRRYMFMQLSKAGYRMREPEVLDPPEEPPSLLAEIVRFHSHDLSYSDEELRQLLAVGENDFNCWYSPGNGSGLRLVQ